MDVKVVIGRFEDKLYYLYLYLFIIIRVYCVGGFNGNGHLSSAEFYDVENRIWIEIPDMLSPRSGCSMISIYDRAFVVGGESGNGKLKSTEV